MRTLRMRARKAETSQAGGGYRAERAPSAAERRPPEEAAMELDAALDYTRAQRRCVLVTINPDGRPQPSRVSQWPSLPAGSRHCDRD